jgi:hypothetical protein
MGNLCDQTTLANNMRALHTFLFIGLTAAVIYLWFFRKPEQIVTVHETTKIVAETPIKRLSSFVDTHLDKAFLPLEAKETLMPSQEIVQIRQTLKDLANQSNSAQDKRLYLLGISVCNKMIEAVSVREQHNRRLADMRRNPSESLLGKEDAERKQRFFESNVIRSWEEKADALRKQIRLKYDEMRLLER